MNQTVEPKKISLPVVVLIVLAGIAFVAGVVYGVQSGQQNPANQVNNFQDCKNAGGTIGESMPEQCFIDGRSFANEPEAIESDKYIGLSETEAAERADKRQISSRVVERDGATLPVTMDFVPGRLNFYIRDGKVYRVTVESAQ